MPDPEDPAEPLAPAVAMANLNVNRPATSIPCKSFNSNVDHLPDFIPIFENACIVATNPSDDKKESTFLQWFPLKLDKRARNLFNSINQANKSWAAIWAELKELLIDPQERYNWKAKKSTIKWDGKETFHALETRVKRAVDLYEDPAVVESEYFFRFRAALPKDYRKAIDLGCEEDARTIENAKKCALRLQLALADDDDDDNAPPSKDVAFSGAAMVGLSDNRVEALEKNLQELSLQMGNLCESMQKDRRDDRSASRGPDRRENSRSTHRRDSSRERYGSHYDDRDLSRRDDYDGRRRNERHEDRRDSHRDNRDHREYRDHEDRRDHHRRDRRNNDDRDYHLRDRSPDHSSDDDYN